MTPRIEIRCRPTTVGEILRLYRPEFEWMFFDGRDANSRRKAAIDLGGRYLFMPEFGDWLEIVLVKYLYLPDADVGENYLYIDAVDNANGTDVNEDFELLEIHPDGNIVVIVEQRKDRVWVVVEVQYV